MSEIVSFELIQKQEELYEEISEIQEEIEILNMLLKKKQNEYFEVNNRLRKNQKLSTG